MSDLEIFKKREYYIAKSNELIQRTKYKLSAEQLRVLGYIISEIKPQDAPNTIYEVDVLDYCKLIGIDATGGKVYRVIKEDLKKIADASAFIENAAGHYSLFRWFNTVDINEGSGKIYITFHETVQPYLFELTSKYTQYRLQDILPFKRKYSIRLWELLKSIKDMRDAAKKNKEDASFCFELDELQTRMDALTYERYTNFKQKALVPAVEEINELAEEFFVEFEERKDGKDKRKVSHIVFILTNKTPMHQMMARQRKRARLD